MFSKKTYAQIEKSLPKIPKIIGENSLRHDIDDLLESALPKMRVCVVDDKFTSEAFGDEVFRAVNSKSENEHINLQGLVEADDEQIKYIRERSKKCDALVAVGSGTINDLCKYASHLEDKPYIVFPTAASMNGYLSANASISFSGHKNTVTAHLPEAIFCDFSVIADAPTRLSQAGLGDSLARPTAQADWLLSHLLLGTTYNNDVFALLEGVEEEVFDSASGIASGDLASIKKLSELLLLSGLGMTIAGGSYPASQGEHMIAHTYGMINSAHSTRQNLHGEEIAITTLHMARLQEKLLRAKPKFASDVFPENKMQKLFGEELAGEFKSEFTKKTARYNNMEINSANWQNIAEKIEKISLPAQKIESILKKAKAPTLPKDISWSDENFKNACDFARFTRDRFTFLDGDRMYI